VSTRTQAEVAAASPTPRIETRWTAGHLPGEAGVWVLILGDMVVFGLFFGVFMVERGNALEVFRAGRESLNTWLGAANTLLLLTGSIFVVLSMQAVREGRGRRARRLLMAAMATGGFFLVDKIIEWTRTVGAGFTPGTNDFYTLFFVFTGIHAFHLVLGLGALAYMVHRAGREPVDGKDLAAMESCASFWHLVDLLWVVLFSLFYLVA
jgi:nitric oxide reductase NorE protein